MPGPSPAAPGGPVVLLQAWGEKVLLESSRRRSQTASTSTSIGASASPSTGTRISISTRTSSSISTSSSTSTSTGAGTRTGTGSGGANVVEKVQESSRGCLRSRRSQPSGGAKLEKLRFFSRICDVYRISKLYRSATLHSKKVLKIVTFQAVLKCRFLGPRRVARSVYNSRRLEKIG